MPKILVVDEDKDIRRLYSEELHEAGYEAITLESGYKLLERIEAEKPDLIIADIKMADCTGLDILHNVRKHFLELPVILVTTCDMNKEDMQSAEVDFYVVKSSDLTELMKKIAVALESNSH
jgi:DNA-binding response OmpR family regulator